MNPITPAILLACAVGFMWAPWRKPGWRTPPVAIVAELAAVSLAIVLALMAGDVLRAPRWLRPWREIVLLAAAYWYALQGGAAVVRLVLDLVPVVERPAKDAILVPTRELSRGRIIGVLERALAVTLVLVGQYGALGLIIAAKALARFRALENRDFAEYFLIGTLASLLHAVLVGVGVKFLI